MLAEILKSIDWTDVLTVLIASIFAYPLGRRKGRQDVLDPNTGEQPLETEHSVQLYRALYATKGGKYGVGNLIIVVETVVELIRFFRIHIHADKLNVWHVLLNLRPLVLALFNIIKLADRILLEIKELDAEDYQALADHIFSYSNNTLRDVDVMQALKAFAHLAKPLKK